MRKKNDILLKSAFEESFADLLYFFFKDADVVFDFERGFDFMDKELAELFPDLEKKGGDRFVDMLVKTYLKTGVEEYILVHIEIQDGAIKNFAQRMFQYYYRILDRFEVEVAALAVFTGKQDQKQPSEYRKDFLGTEIIYKYNSYHIFDHTEDQLLSMDNLFALVILTAQKVSLSFKIPESELGEQRLGIVRALVESKRYDNEKIRRFLFFLKTFIYIENSEINGKFDSEVNLLTGNETSMGIIEAIKMITLEEGIEKGEYNKTYEIVKNLIVNTDFEISKVAALANCSESLVEKVQEDLRLGK
ncbi:hypothetical protein Dfri01_02290 [Dyadobacter frigoris]|uniref:Transposase (putative) YhgA-like domain-containing protein n=2 Tax=Dyadobacter frigoris TaxID=2576211 RepID=A0A4U6D952_9BACT|nr:hypothetical protein FDK13_02020 [Dyadobacter frigoris]GLU50768.1 hypothetical protein Dfri01_02290 [Dyadobacter frigoris]